jgi:uncharacterized protein YcfJ
MLAHRPSHERNIMNTKLIGIAAAVAAGACLGTPAMAADYGTIISKTAVVGAVAVPQRQCVDQQRIVQQPQTGGGALVGALVGGGLGNAVGGGAGRAAATGLGVIAGALIGDRVEANATPPVAIDTQQCQVVSQMDNRVVGYDVVYDFNGQRYSTRLASDPGNVGDRIALNVTPTAATVAAAVPQTIGVPVGVPVSVPVAAAPAVVYAASPYWYGPVYPPIGLSVDLGYGWGRGWGGRRWH